MAFDLLATPSEHNIAWAWVTTLLPDDKSSPWGFAMAVFSSTLTFVGALFIGWHVLSAIVSAAYKGQVVQHHVWTPLRIILGFGLMVPIAANFSSSHYLLRDVIARGAINLADSVWVAYVDYAAGKEVKIAPMSPGGKALVYDILESEICTALVNTVASSWSLRQIPLPSAGGERIADRGWFGGESNGRQAWRYGENCGSIVLPELADKPGFTADRAAAVADVVTGVRALAAPFGPLFAKYHESFSVEQARALVHDGRIPADLAQQIHALGRAYDAAITAATDKEMQLDGDAAARRQKLVDAAKQQGFVTAGMWWGHISARSQAVAAMTGEQHDRVSPRIGETGSASHESLKAALDTLRYAVTGQEAEIGLSANDFAAAGDENSDLLTRGFAYISRPLNEWMLDWLAAGSGDGRSTVERMKASDPIGSQISSGHFFMGTATAVILALTGAIALAFTLPADTVGLDGAAIWAMGWLAPPLGTLWVIGAVRAYILPILPFVYMWIFGSLWLLAVLETAIALVVWAFSFLRLDGEEFLAQQSKMGAMLLFNVFLMPVLGLLAFCACFILLPLIIGGIEIFWATAFYGQQGGHLPGLGATLVGFVVITFLSMYLVMHIFGQIFHIPDRIVVWFGGSSHGFSDKSLFVATAGAAAAVLGKGMPGLPSIPKPKKPEDENGGGGSGGGVTQRGASE